MKKYIILAIIVIIAVGSISYMFASYRINNLQIEENNKMYTDIYNKEITGTELATIINKTIDRNEKNEVQKDESGFYIENETNSIIIEIKFKEAEEIIRTESISTNGIENFINFYSNFKFKCTKIEYHAKTNFTKYLYFEEI